MIDRYDASATGVIDIGAATDKSPSAVGASWTKLALANFGVAITAFGIAATIAVMQAMSRANADLPFRSPRIFYLSVTAHGFLMALVFTTFFVMGLGYVFARVSLRRPIEGERLGWMGFWVALAGTLMAVAVILAGKASVLYTFYPPLEAHPLFYIGTTLLVVGSWIWCFVMVQSYRAWRRETPSKPVPLPMHGIMASVIVWVLATLGVAAEMIFLLIPWSLGFRETVDPVLARTLFWWFGHPLVYFWLVPAYTLWYTVLPKEAGGKLFSDPLARLVFILFVLFSTPVGLHHQFTDPGITAGWKLIHTMNTYVILFPSFITAFTLIASLEIAGRARGATGLFNWVARLPWREPFFASIALAMLIFSLGGIGGAINAAYGMNAVIHNTAWVQGHFHLTAGTATGLTFMGATYWLLPRLTGKPLRLPAFAAVQPYLWFVGMLMFSIVNHATGLMGMPRRVFDASYGGHPAAESWLAWTGLSAIGGVILFASAMCFVAVVVATITNRRGGDAPAFAFAEPVGGTIRAGTILDRFGFWTIAAVVMIVLAYAYPIFDLLRMERFGAPGLSPF